MTVGKVKDFNFSSGGMTKGHTKDFTFSSDSKSKAKGYADGGSPKSQATSPSPTRGLGGRPLPIMQRPLPVPQQSSIGGRDKPDNYDRDGSNARNQAMKLARQQERFGGGMQRPGGPINTLPMPPQRPEDFGMPPPGGYAKPGMPPGMSQDQKMQDYQRFVQNQQMNGAPVLPMAQWDKMRVPMGQPDNAPPPGMGGKIGHFGMDEYGRGAGQGFGGPPPGMGGMPSQLGGGMPPPGMAGLGQAAMQQAGMGGQMPPGVATKFGMPSSSYNTTTTQDMMGRVGSGVPFGQAMGQLGMGGGMQPQMPPQPQIQTAPPRPPSPSQAAPMKNGGMAKPMGYAKGGKVMGKFAAAPQGMIKNRGTLGVVGNKNPGETKMNTAPNLPSEKTMMNKGGKAMMGGGKMMKNSAMKKGGMAKSNKNC
jgi:hypothetical protein